MKKRSKWESLKIDASVLDKAREKAKKNRRTVKATVEIAIERDMANDDKE
mgnify:CR=1 FL=1